MAEVCRVCKAQTIVHNLLHYCTSEACGAVHWDKPAARKKAKLLRKNVAGDLPENIDFDVRCLFLSGIFAVRPNAMTACGLWIL